MSKLYMGLVQLLQYDLGQVKIGCGLCYIASVQAHLIILQELNNNKSQQKLWHKQRLVSNK